MTTSAFQKRWTEFADADFGGFNDMPDKAKLYRSLLALINDIDDFIISFAINGQFGEGGDTIFIKFKEKVSPSIFRILTDLHFDEFDPARPDDVKYCTSIAAIFPENVTNWYRLWWD